MRSDKDVNQFVARLEKSHVIHLRLQFLLAPTLAELADA